MMQRRGRDHLLWLVPALLLGSLSPFILRSGWTGSFPLELVADTVVVFAALGIVVAGLLRYSLHRTRLSLFFSLSFLAAAFIDGLHVLLSIMLAGFSLEVRTVFVPHLWIAARASLAILLLLGVLFDRFASVVEKALVEVIVAIISVLAIAGLAVLLLPLVAQVAPVVALLELYHVADLMVGGLYLVALPLYFNIYRSREGPLWATVVVSIVVNIFGQIWGAYSTTLYDMPFLAAHIAFVISCLVILTGFQLLGVRSEWEALTGSELKSQVIRMASHDLINPLTQAMGYFELLVEDFPSLDEPHLHLVEHVRAGHKRMQTLVQDLLDLERLEAGELEERETISVGELVDFVVSGMKPFAAAQEQTLNVHIAPNLPPVEVALTQMRQALSNLLDNAIKYTPAGGVIEVRAQLAGDDVQVVVSDNGLGIPEEAQSKLFERFYRVRQPGTEDIRGTGLGLSLVKGVIEMHDGTITVESAPGEGSTFTINLPASKPSLPL